LKTCACDDTQYRLSCAMVFASLIFLFIFLPLNLALYYIFGNKDYRNWLLVVFSFFFYSWGEPVWIVLLIISALVDYVNGLVIERYRGTIGEKIGLISSLVINLGLLGTFKYSGFITENINALFGLDLDVPGFTLPIGISFYTFQTISYTVDVYRGEVKAQRSFMKFMMFVSLYHQLVAGPIVRYQHIAHEIDHRTVDVNDISLGVTRFCQGLFKKVFFANIAGDLAQPYLEGNIEALSMGGSWFGIILFSLQIYFDFSGYSDMAIGLGRMFGFHYHENFNHPYTAKSATDFWRRWHISLGTFFRDYLYIPLGGNKQNFYRNLLIVWFLTGLWHGASWNFIFWGLYFGILIALERLFFSKLLARLPVFFSHAYLILVAIFGWVIFYFTDMSRLGSYLGVMSGLSGHAIWDVALGIQLQANFIWFMIAILFCMPVGELLKAKFEHRLSQKQLQVMPYAQTVLNVAMFLIAVSFLVGKSYNPFLYFRF
jgi:alginate O-acetyltransferase complex protein AlgI